MSGGHPAMRYILPCLLPSPVRAYHRALVDELAARFDLRVTQRQAIPAHFTLKYHFETDDITPVETLLADFAGRHAAAPVTVGDFGHFEENVVFATVTLSPAAQTLLEALFSALRPLGWMPWSPHDGAHLRPHMTLAEDCRARFGEVWRHLTGRARQFPAALDNLTLLRQTGADEDGLARWALHRTFTLAGAGGLGEAGASPPR
jgi:2'-5' RNA ligase